jgi:hypothetical protein
VNLLSALPLPLDISFGNILWSIVIIFFMVIFIVLLFQIFGDLFSDDSLSGWAKAGWTIFIILVPFLGILVYVIARGKGMTERRARDVETAQKQFDARVREVAGSGGPAEEIARAKELLDSGAITQEEFEAIKRKQLA